MMTTEVKKLVVHVLVQTEAGYDSGTGLVVGPGKVLTAAHVLNQLKACGTLEIRVCELEPGK